MEMLITLNKIYDPPPPRLFDFRIDHQLSSNTTDLQSLHRAFSVRFEANGNLCSPLREAIPTRLEHHVPQLSSSRNVFSHRRRLRFISGRPRKMFGRMCWQCGDDGVVVMAVAAAARRTRCFRLGQQCQGKASRSRCNT